VPLTELGDNACHWPVAGEGVATMFSGADRGGNSHPWYCRLHAMRSVAVSKPVGLVTSSEIKPWKVAAAMNVTKVTAHFRALCVPEISAHANGRCSANRISSSLHFDRY
jgi:hypothetical protein